MRHRRENSHRKRNNKHTFADDDRCPHRTFPKYRAATARRTVLYRFIYLRRTRYHIGSEQLISRHGVLSRKTDYMEQYRIVDFVEHQSLMQQLCGLKTVRILSMDRNTPRLDLVGIRHNFDVVTLIRERVEYNKRKKGIYEITNH